MSARRSRTAAPLAGLRESLRREHAKREAGVDQLIGKSVRRLRAALDDLLGEADLRGVSHSFLDACERATVEKIGRVYGVAAASQLVCKCLEAFGLTLRVVEKQHLCHSRPSPRSRDRIRARAGPAFGNVTRL